uniref:procollagen-proline 4-dioxygenase n=1 Tax=Dunaliella tertiolecta TaxID=3047 RepID=A0A7S3QKD7_DUNTE
MCSRAVCLLLVALCLLANGGRAYEGSGHTVGYGELQEEWRGEVIHLSWSPRAFLLKGFLSDEECDHLIAQAQPSMQKSSVVDNETGKSVDSQIRTSTGTFLRTQADDIVSRIEKRVAQVTMIPQEHQEAMQILHYEYGQKYEPHNDYFHDPVNSAPSTGGQRVATVLMYLTTPTEGGETVLPNADTKSTGPEWSECAQKGLAVKAKRGDALLFYSLKPDGTEDPASLHGSCPVLGGEKWSATKWIHVSPFQPRVTTRSISSTNDGCEDTQDKEQCLSWAFFGECEKNPGYMLTNCRKSCKQCGKDKGARVITQST